MKSKFALILIITTMVGKPSVFAQRTLSFDLTDDRPIIVKKISTGLVLRIEKDRSLNTEDFGWLVGVYKTRDKKFRRNLIYQNRTGTTADDSQIYAWQIKNCDFTEQRTLRVKGTRRKIRIALVDPVAEGSGPDSKFISGTLSISW